MASDVHKFKKTTLQIFYKPHIFMVFLFIYFPVFGFAAHHWLLEDGVIKNQVDSLYQVHKPSDLLLFMKQSAAVDELRNLEKQQEELQRQHEMLVLAESKRRHQERVAFYSDPDCRIAQKKLSQFDLHLSSFLRLEAKDIRIPDYLDYKAALPKDLKQPFCMSEFLFSMNSYDHLKGVAERKLLSNSSEGGLVNAVPQAKEIAEFGHRIFNALNKNETSWVLLNFASIYWRVFGNGYQAVECLRRALHYSPRKEKDLALVGLANILHRAGYSLDAAILMHAALETTSDYDIVYFTLGNIYGALGQFDLADICYKYVSDLQPDFEAARLRMHAARCEHKLGSAMDSQLLQQSDEELDKDSAKQQIVEDQQNGAILERSTPLRKYDIYSVIQTPAYERGDDYYKDD